MNSLRLNDYQKQALATDRMPSDNAVQVALLGLAGETGSLHTLYKKRLRDGERFSEFGEKLKEELGDILWYLTAITHHAGLTLDDVARANLEKACSRWVDRGEDDEVAFDDHFPLEEQLPREFEAEFVCSIEDGIQKTDVFVDGEKCGATLRDNAYVSDGYRFHDIFHMTCASMLGWSPVVRALLRRKRKSDPQIDEVEDGGRAIVADEALAAVVFDYAHRHDFLKDVEYLDQQLLDLCHNLTKWFEVAKRSRYEWEQTILKAFDLWRSIQQNSGGRVHFDMTNRLVEYLPPVATG